MLRSSLVPRPVPDDNYTHLPYLPEKFDYPELWHAMSYPAAISAAAPASRTAIRFRGEPK